MIDQRARRVVTLLILILGQNRHECLRKSALSKQAT